MVINQKRLLKWQLPPRSDSSASHQPENDEAAWCRCQQARCSSEGKQSTQTVKSNGNQNSARSVDQSVNEDLRDSAASCRGATRAVGAKTCGGQTSLQDDGLAQDEKDWHVPGCYYYFVTRKIQSSSWVFIEFYLWDHASCIGSYAGITVVIYTSHDVPSCEYKGSDLEDAPGLISENIYERLIKFELKQRGQRFRWHLKGSSWPEAAGQEDVKRQKGNTLKMIKSTLIQKRKKV